MALRIRCPTCRKTFVCKTNAELPDECPNGDCESRLWNKLGQNREDDDIVLPFISTSGKTKATDKVYRDIEKGSEVRAQAAAEMTGSSVAEMSALKITDLRPTTRHGDVAAVPVVNAVTQQMDMMRAAGRPVGFGGMDGSGMSSEISSGAVSVNGQVVHGIAPSAGARARTALQAHHTQLTGGAAVSDRPANEVLQPGYRIRG